MDLWARFGLGIGRGIGWTLHRRAGGRLPPEADVPHGERELDGLVLTMSGQRFIVPELGGLVVRQAHHERAEVYCAGVGRAGGFDRLTMSGQRFIVPELGGWIVKWYGWMVSRGKGEVSLF